MKGRYCRELLGGGIVAKEYPNADGEIVYDFTLTGGHFPEDCQFIPLLYSTVLGDFFPLIEEWVSYNYLCE